MAATQRELITMVRACFVHVKGSIPRSHALCTASLFKCLRSCAFSCSPRRIRDMEI